MTWMKHRVAAAILSSSFLPFASAGHAEAQVVSLLCTSTYNSYPSTQVEMWIDLKQSLAVQALQHPVGETQPSPVRTLPPQPLAISPQQFVWLDGSGMQLNRLTGNGSFNGGQISCAKANIPYPLNAPPIAPKF